ncbi:hypothetical protein FHS29_003140 [Saccharothrix tamanrassetensis]|uniref:Uncharacterized protein n=1 Tax=Saccharothrix tamanrassetensis TaxID=1051531 RepID=A0A841CJM6_9PSEU|nr:hypothetical protein [Saccharothrix tamanrassetensis]MBB5956554.1 hypothetical protein [Saccharothrix tamanrassetensis]
MSTDAPAPNPNFPPAPQQHQEPEAPKKKSLVVRILTAVAGLLVAGLVIYGFNYFTSDAAQSKAGECASLTGTSTKPDFKTVDCGSAEANYTIAKVLDSTSGKCDGQYYDQYTETARRGPDSKLCLIPTFKEGSCYELTSSTTTMGYPPVDCGKAEVLKLVKHVKGSDDESACGDGMALAFPEPKQAFCFEPVLNS